MSTTASPLHQSASQSVCWNFKLLAHHELGGFGGMGEGMAVQVAKDGRRIIWLAHESAPKNFTAVDVSDPKSGNAQPAFRCASCGLPSLQPPIPVRRRHGWSRQQELYFA
jgi:hypothetical protein